MTERLVRPGITVGNVASIVTTLVAAGGIIVGVTIAQNSNTKDIEAVRSSVTVINAELGAARAAIRQLEISEARTAERYNSILTSQNKTEATLAEINQLLRERRDP